MFYLIRLKDHFPPKVVTGTCIETIKRAYPEWKVYCYRATGNPVSVNLDQEWRINREVLPNVRYNKHCIWS